jgi:hypothetical protein
LHYIKLAISLVSTILNLPHHESEERFKNFAEYDVEFAAKVEERLSG